MFSEGDRNFAEFSGVMPRRANNRATIGETLASAQSASTCSASGFGNDHRTGGLLFVLIGIINQDAVIIVGRTLQPLIRVIPWSRNFVQKHHALAREAKLNVAYFAYKTSQPAGFFQLFFIHVLNFLQSVNQQVYIFFVQ